MNLKSFFGNWIVKNLTIAVILLTALIIAPQFILKGITQHGKEYTVPDMTNMSVEEAAMVAAAHEMRIQVIDSVYVKRMDRGAVYKHSPEAGSKVKQGRRILLTINAVLPKSVLMPNLVGYSMRQAKAELQSRGLKLGRLIYVKDIATNNVLSQVYRNSEIEPGTKIESESVIDLVVGLNESDNITYVPALIGTRYMNAVNALHDNSLNLEGLHFDNTVRNYSDSLNAMVFMQSPASSLEEPCRMGTAVSLYLTLDRNKVLESLMPAETEDEAAAAGKDSTHGTAITAPAATTDEPVL